MDIDLKQLSKHELEEQRKYILSELKRRYRRNRLTKYGLMNKGFTETEFRLFYDAIEDKKIKAIIAFMAGMGLRISEACSIKYIDFDLSQRCLFICSKKDSFPSMMLLHEFVYDALTDYLSTIITPHPVYLFPSEKKSCKTQYISPAFVRKIFRQIRAKVELNFVYGSADDERQKHPLYRLTTHSLRHYFITTCSKKLNGDVALVQKLARHKDVKNTLRYIHTPQEEINRAILHVFNSNAEEIGLPRLGVEREDLTRLRL